MILKKLFLSLIGIHFFKHGKLEVNIQIEVTQKYLMIKL